MKESITQPEDDLASDSVDEAMGRYSTKYSEGMMTVYDEEGNVIYYSTLDRSSKINYRK